MRAAKVVGSAALDIEQRLIELLTDAEGLERFCSTALEGDDYAHHCAVRLVAEIQAIRQRLDLCRVEAHPEWEEAFGATAMEAQRAREVQAARKLCARLRREAGRGHQASPGADDDDDIPRDEDGAVDWDRWSAKTPAQRRAEARAATHTGGAK